jgi:hypothetical protein
MFSGGLHGKFDFKVFFVLFWVCCCTSAAASGACRNLTWLEPGHPASDYSCPACGFWYQLKSQKSRIGESIGAIARLMFLAGLSFFPCLIFKCFTPI